MPGATDEWPHALQAKKAPPAKKKSTKKKSPAKPKVVHVAAAVDPVKLRRRSKSNSVNYAAFASSGARK